MELIHISPVKGSVCFLCVSRQGSQTSAFTQNSWHKVFGAAQVRNDQIKQKLLSHGYTENLPEMRLCYHKTCYTSYTSKQNLSRFSVAQDQPGSSQSPALESPGNETDEPRQKRLRSSAESYGLREAKCIFCLGNNKKVSLSKFQTTKGVTEVQERNQIDVHNDQDLHARLNQDLIAIEARYHNNCRLAYIRNTIKETQTDKDSRDCAFAKLIQSLDKQLLTGNAVKLVDLCDEINKYRSEFTDDTSAAARYQSSMLKLKLVSHYGDQIVIYQPRNKSQSQLIYSSKITLDSVLQKASKVKSGGSTSTFPAQAQVTPCLDDESVLTHAAGILRHAIIENRSSVAKIEDLSADAVLKFIPNKINQFMSALIGSGQDTVPRGKVCSISQDLMNLVKPMRTPKSICLAVAIKNLTNSKVVIDHLHHLGHCISYKDTLAMDKNMADEILSSAVEVGMVIPSNILHRDQGGGLIQAAADNIDFSEETLDGKNTTHATSAVLYQTNHFLTKADIAGVFAEAASPALSFKRKKPTTSATLHLNDITAFKDGSKIRQLAAYRDRRNINLATDSRYRKTQLAMDQAWMLCRHLSTKLVVATEQRVPSWSSLTSRVSLPMRKTEIGYLPLWNSSPTDISVVYTVMMSIQDLTNHMGQEHTIITFDQAIYKTAKQIQWKRPSQFKNMVIRLGGFHILMNYLGTIGKMVAGSGVAELLVDAGLYSETTTTSILKGKQYNRGVRAHKLLMEALGRCEWEEFAHSIAGKEEILQTLNSQADAVAALCEADAPSDALKKAYDAIITTLGQLTDEYVTFQSTLKTTSQLATFWYTYMESVELMLAFIRAEHSQNWELHISTVREMTPFFHAFDRQNYSRWLCVYLADMLNLKDDAPEVEVEFMAGRFGVQRSERPFCSVWTDMALEQSLNRDVKCSGGLVGITKRDEARDRWFVTNHMRSIITSRLGDMATPELSSRIKHGEDYKSRSSADHKAVCAIVDKLKSGMKNPFNAARSPTVVELTNICTGAKPTAKAAERILGAYELGELSFREFVDKRMLSGEVEFLAPISRVNVPPFVEKKKKKAAKNKTDSLVSDRALFGRLIIAAQHRHIDLHKLFCHELAAYPLSLADNQGVMRNPVKSKLAIEIEKEVTGGIPIHQVLERENTAYIIDAMALIQKHKAQLGQNFGEYASKIHLKIQSLLRHYSRVDLVFDRYDGQGSIKNSQRDKRGASLGGDVIIHSDDTPIPNWTRFVSNEGNKVRLSNYLVSYLQKHSFTIAQGKTLVIGGGSDDPHKCYIINGRECKELPTLFSDHEEADTRMILHALQAYQSCSEVTIGSPDTDVLVIAAYHFRKAEQLSTENDSIKMWFHTGSGLKDRYIPVHKLALQDSVVCSLPGFHTLTGCDTTSSFSGKGKLTAFKLLQTDMCRKLLQGIGESWELSDATIQQASQFVIKLYGSGMDTLNLARYQLFSERHLRDEQLPPTEDAFLLHLKRANYQACIWRNADKPRIKPPTITEHGWEMTDAGCRIMFSTLPPAPKDLEELTACKCRSSQCRSNACSCRKKGLICTESCRCTRDDCCNIPDEDEDEDSDGLSDFDC